MRATNLPKALAGTVHSLLQSVSEEDIKTLFEIIENREISKMLTSLNDANLSKVRIQCIQTTLNFFLELRNGSKEKT